MVTNRDDNHAGSGVQERVLSVLLNEMDGIGSNYKVSKFVTYLFDYVDLILLCIFFQRILKW